MKTKLEHLLKKLERIRLNSDDPVVVEHYCEEATWLVKDILYDLIEENL